MADSGSSVAGGALVRCVEYPLCKNEATTWAIMKGGRLVVPLCLDHVKHEPARTLKPIERMSHASKEVRQEG